MSIFPRKSDPQITVSMFPSPHSVKMLSPVMPKGEGSAEFKRNTWGVLNMSDKQFNTGDSVMVIGTCSYGGAKLVIGK